MKLLEQMARINRLHELIKHRRTGTPRQLAVRLRISEARLYQIIDELKAHNAPIMYCRQRRCYYYAHAFEIQFSARFGASDEAAGAEKRGTDGEKGSL